MDKDENKNSSESSAEELTEEEGSETSKGGDNTLEPNSEENVPLHKHPRFKEVIEEKNAYRNRLAQVEAEKEALRAEMMRNRDESGRKPSYASELEELKAVGADTNVASKLLDIVERIATRKSQETLRPVANDLVKTKVSNSIRNFKESHEDYDKYSQKMGEVFETLPPSDKAWVMSSEEGVAHLYLKAKSLDKNSEQEIEDKGRNDAYKSKALKSSISGTRGDVSSSKGSMTTKEFEELDLETYGKNQKKFEEAHMRALGILK